ncbi:MAG TPA: hypothetical protein VGO55_03035 [Allosphingosinicella sp.]|jgi:hypothetical protein|nr:hypothetical protein [Allosphingosinicella sp.]
MTAQARVALMPDWPARMGEDLASLYLGVSQSTFRDRVSAGSYPQPISDGRRRLWSRRQLDRYVDAQFGLPQTGDPEDGSWDDLK